MGKLRYFYGTMASGKSTLALQMNHNFELGNKKGILITMKDRSGESKITTRIGLECDAEIIDQNTNLFYFVEDFWSKNQVDYVICDEVQFYTPEQIDQLGSLVDFYDVDVFCFGITTDFTSNLFPASKRLFEIADYKIEIEVKTLCWCGRKAIMNARVRNGYITFEGDIIQVGNVGDDDYEPLCRSHFNSKITKKRAREYNLI